MYFQPTLLKSFTAVLFSIFIISCSKKEAVNNVSFDEKETVQKTSLSIHKRENCGCCHKWIDHINANGFQSLVTNNENLSYFKKSLGLSNQYHSCHTGISEEGYIFEGHIPAKFIHQFLKKHIKGSLGLSVPAMPIGSPGMEVEDRFMPYQILLLANDGSATVYKTVQSYKEQF